MKPRSGIKKKCLEILYMENKQNSFNVQDQNSDASILSLTFVCHSDQGSIASDGLLRLEEEKPLTALNCALAVLVCVWMFLYLCVRGNPSYRFLGFIKWIIFVLFFQRETSKLSRLGSSFFLSLCLKLSKRWKLKRSTSSWSSRWKSAWGSRLWTLIIKIVNTDQHEERDCERWSSRLWTLIIKMIVMTKGMGNAMMMLLINWSTRMRTRTMAFMMMQKKTTLQKCSWWIGEQGWAWGWRPEQWWSWERG